MNPVQRANQVQVRVATADDKRMLPAPPGRKSGYGFRRGSRGQSSVSRDLCGFSIRLKGENLKNFSRAIGVALVATVVLTGLAGASTPGADTRLTLDCAATAPTGTPAPGACGYVSSYTLATGNSYSDSTLAECSVSHGRQNEPSVAVDPRNTSLLIGSSNDYCGVYNQTSSTGVPLAVGPIWLGYYRSQDAGTSWLSSLVPGYPGDTSPYASLSDARTASSGDPVIAWDNHGRVFMGSESSDDPAGTAKTFGDVWVAHYANPAANPDAAGVDKSNDGLAYGGTTVVSRGSSAPNLLGNFYDKTAIEADRTGGGCDGNVYFSYSRFSGNGGVAIYLSRSTDHGRTFSQQTKLSASLHDVQFPDIAVTGNGDVYVTFRAFAAQGGEPDEIEVVKSTDCGQTFTQPQTIVTFTPSDASDISAPEAMPTPQSAKDDPATEAGSGDSAAAGTARDCGDFSSHCLSGYTFFRRDTQVRSTADQLDHAHQYVYLVFDGTKAGTVAPAATSYSSVTRGSVGQAAISFIRYDGAAGTHTAPAVISDQATGNQVFPDISADGGVLHTIWWDSRNDTCFSIQRPIGNCADKTTVPSLDTYGAVSTNPTASPVSWAAATRISDRTTNPNYEQFGNRVVPFAGDYLWVTSVGSYAYSAWTDWRDTVQGVDQREVPEDGDAATADVHQCRVLQTSTVGKGKSLTTVKSWSSDLCPHAGGIDQNIYGDLAP